MGSLTARVNWLNLTTPVGLVLARAAGCPVNRRGPFYEACGYRYRFPLAGAFTIGSVVISRTRLDEAAWQHETVHIRQYAWCGPMFLPLYGMGAAWSWVRCGDWWSRNVFERRAGLAAGGYVERPPRRAGRSRPGVPAAAAAVS